jgi:hypothetical protein
MFLRIRADCLQVLIDVLLCNNFGNNNYCMCEIQVEDENVVSVMIGIFEVLSRQLRRGIKR